MTDPVGPLYAAGLAPITASGYTILFLPDAKNTELQNEGKAPIYYWLPNEVRLARRGGDGGDFAFSMIHFVGVRNEDSHVGVEGTEEVSGGLLGFSTTTAPPGAVLQEAQDQITAIHKGSTDRWWGWRSMPPQFRPVPIVSNTTSVTNLSPNPDGSVPVAGPSPTPAPAPAPAPTPGPTPPSGPPRSVPRASLPPEIGSGTRAIVQHSPRTVVRNNAMRDNNLDPWYVHMQGQGPGSVSPLAENAYSGLMGSYPAALAWAAFHGGTGAFTVWQNMKLRVVSPVMTLDIVGDWSEVQTHFSAAAHAGGWFWEADIKAEFNNMRQSGVIKVNCFVDTTLPGADKMTEAMDKRSDLIFQKFMDQAQKAIFDTPPFNEKPAEADGGGFLGLGGGVAFKLRQDRTTLKLEYHERREIAYFQDYPISGQLEGMHEQIAADPAAEKKYFTTLYLSDWERKVSRVVVPVVNWPDAARKWVGQPAAFLSFQTGYPNTEGVVQWDGHLFQPTEDPAKANWTTATEMKKLEDVKNPPAGWSPEKTFIKRKIHFTEPPSALENPYVRMDVEKNVVDLDPGELGTLTDEINHEVRVDEVGGLAVGPIMLNVDLETPKQTVEVTFQALGTRDDGAVRPPVKFGWTMEDQYEPRIWSLFTGQPDFVPKYQYQVRVVVKGSIFTKGMEWTGPWQDASASGPLMVSVPTPEDPGVVSKSLHRAELPAATPTPPPTTSQRPPSTSTRPPSKGSSKGRTAKPLPVGWSTPPTKTKAKAATTTATGNDELLDLTPFSSYSSTPPA